MEHQRLIDIFIDLVRINALSGNEKPVADYIKTFLSSLNYNPFQDNSYIKTNSNTGNVICRCGTGGDFLLLSHMDTAAETQKINPIVMDDRIVTDGTTILGSDNRAGIAAILYSIEKAKKENINLRDFTVAFTTCEETTLGGSKNIELNGNIKKGFVFDSSYRPGKFIYSSCGAKTFNIVVKGKAAHSGIEPEKGINSIAVTANAISKTRQGRIDEDTTVNIGRISGGGGINIVPEKCIIDGEIRSFNTDTVEIISNEIKQTFEKEADKLNASVTFTDYWDFEPYSHSLEDEVILEIKQAIEATGIEATPVISFGGSDANSLNAKGIKAVNIGIGAQNPHSVDEFILIEDLIRTAEIASNLIKMK